LKRRSLGLFQEVAPTTTTTTTTTTTGTATRITLATHVVEHLAKKTSD